MAVAEQPVEIGATDFPSLEAEIAFARDALRTSEKWDRIARTGQMRCQESVGEPAVAVPCPICEAPAQPSRTDWASELSKPPGVVSIKDVPAYYCPECDATAFDDDVVESMYSHAAAFAMLIGDVRKAQCFEHQARLYRRRREQAISA